MAGHSQFKNIMHRKGRQDARRARTFTRLVREVQVAARAGLPDPAANPRLRSALQAARAANVPKENIERAIRRGSGSDGESFEEVRYEGYGPGGVALIVETLTDNRNRTAAEVRAAFSRLGGSLGETGSVSYQFDRVGEIVYPAEAADPDTMLEAAIEAGAEDCRSDRERPRDHLRPGRPRRGSRRARGAPRPARGGAARLAAAGDRADRRGPGRDAVPAARDPGRKRRRPARDRQLRGRRRGPRAIVRLMRLLGLDPGLQRTGWGMIEAQGNGLRFLAAGVVATDPAQGLASRLDALYRGLQEVVARHRPQAAAVEETVVNVNAESSLKLGHARGVVLLAAAHAGLEVTEYAAKTVKRVGGRHRGGAKAPGRDDGAHAVAGQRSGRRRCRRRAGGGALSCAPPHRADPAARSPGAGAGRRGGRPVIARLRGTLDGLDQDHAVIDVGGVGYLVACSTRTLAALPRPGEAVDLLIETQVRGGQHHALRLLDLRRAQLVPPAPDRAGGRRPGGARDPRRCSGRTSWPARWRPRTRQRSVARAASARALPAGSRASSRTG